MSTPQSAADAIVTKIYNNPQHRLSADEAAILEAAPERTPMMDKIIALYLHNTGDFENALIRAQKVFQNERNRENAKNISLIYRKLGRFDDGIQFAHDHEDLFDPIVWNDILSMLHWNKGDRDGAIRHGNQALVLKDASAKPAPPLTPVTRAFDAARPQRNVISFSLFGQNPRYLSGAVQNAIVARYLYPGWSMRVYVDDSVPAAAVQTLIREGAQVKKVQGNWDAAKYGLFWRFLVEDDPEVDFYLIRDADSVMNIKERAAVEDWLAAGRAFHIMRDRPSHSELILAGMWGAQRGNIGRMQQRIEATVENQGKLMNYVTIDQVFLREQIWPIVKQDVLMHDACFDFGEPTRYRTEFALPETMHIGQNDWIHRARKQAAK